MKKQLQSVPLTTPKLSKQNPFLLFPSPTYLKKIKIRCHVQFNQRINYFKFKKKIKRNSKRKKKSCIQ